MSDLFKLLQQYYYQTLGLLIGYVVAFIVILSLKDMVSRTALVLIYVVTGIIWSVVWFFSRNYFPKISKGKLGLIVAIDAESTKQKSRIKVDFFENLKEMLTESGIAYLFDFVVLSDYKSMKAGEILRTYSEKSAEISSLQKENKVLESPPKEYLRWEKFNKKIRGNLYIWGNIKERKDLEITYILKMDALVVHRPVTLETSEKIRKEFLSIFPRRISFFEKFETKGFEFTANAVYLASRYITGLAAFISGDPITALKLHNGLRKEISGFVQPLPPNLVYISNQLAKIVVSENLWIAKHAYFVRRDIRTANKIIQECLQESENYEALILSSIITFKEERDPARSLSLLRRAKKVSRGDFTWLYNKAFILMYLGKFTKGLNDYKKLVRLWFADEQNIVDQCIDFNRELLRLEPDKIQSFFILGYLYYKKKRNFPMALESFETFQEKARADEKTYEPLIAPTSSYLSEIRKQMRL